MSNIIQELQEIVAEICDHYCRYPYMLEDQERLDGICKGCPLNRIWGGYEE